MPPKNKHRSTASPARKRSDRRKNKPVSRRKTRDNEGAKDPRIIGGSLFALTLKDKPALEVVDKTSTKMPRQSILEEDDYYRMYEDLYAAFVKGVKLATGETTRCNPLKEGMGIGSALSYVVKGFENNILPKGFDLRIDRRSNGEYYFTMYTQCAFPEHWHAFELKPVIEHLARTNTQLHDLFLSFMAYMHHRLSIPTWFDGGCGYAETAFEERLDYWEDNVGELEPRNPENPNDVRDAEESRQSYEDAQDDFFHYEAGVIHQYQNALRTGLMPMDKVKRKIAAMNNRHPVVRFMKKALAFMKEPGCVFDYHYPELMDDEGYEGLTFDRQVTIIWDWDDHFTAVEMEAIESEAQNAGGIPPIFHYHVTKDTKEIPLEKFDDWRMWPVRLHELWAQYRDLALSYKKDKKKKK